MSEPVLSSLAGAVNCNSVVFQGGSFASLSPNSASPPLWRWRQLTSDDGSNVLSAPPSVTLILSATAAFFVPCCRTVKRFSRVSPSVCCLFGQSLIKRLVKKQAVSDGRTKLIGRKRAE